MLESLTDVVPVVTEKFVMHYNFRLIMLIMIMLRLVTL